MAKKSKAETKAISPARYAVVGLGWIAQDSILPAFRAAKSNSRLTALVSDDPEKLKQLGRQYDVEHLYQYDEFEDCLSSGEIDAVFIALPNHLHCQYSVAAAKAGIHVLCEKPMASTVAECRKMIAAATESDVRLMIAYRLHFEPANLGAIELANSGDIGDPRIVMANYTQQIEPGNVRLDRERGGGVLPDIGIYCLNAARAIFRSEPEEVFAMAASGADPRFSEVSEMVAATLRFPGQRLAQFTCSFGAARTSVLTLIGSEGSLRLDPAFSHRMKPRGTVKVGERQRTLNYPELDQFAAELVYFSNCIQRNSEPSPSGWEGMADVQIIAALQKSIVEGIPIRVDSIHPPRRPSVINEIRLTPSRKTRLARSSRR